MHYTELVCRLYTLSYLDGYARRLAVAEHDLGLDEALERHALHQLHHYIVKLTLVHYVVDLHYIRMRQTCRRLGFYLEFADKCRIGAVFLLQHLDCYRPVECMIQRLIYVAHAACADAA